MRDRQPTSDALGLEEVRAERPVSAERRRRPRFLYSTSITVRRKDGIAVSAISVDLSTRGLSAIVSEPLTASETVVIEEVAGGPVWARVRHKLGQLYGFEFMELTAQQKTLILDAWEKSRSNSQSGKRGRKGGT